MQPDTATSSSYKLIIFKPSTESKIEGQSANCNWYENKKLKDTDLIPIEESGNQSPAIIHTHGNEVRNPVNTIRLYIKNMVSLRCKMMVKSELAKLGIQNAIVRLGEVELKNELSHENYDKFNDALKRIGFELIKDKRSILVEKIKNVIVEMIHYSEEPTKIKISRHLSNKLNYHYTYLSNLFSRVHGTSIEKFLIAHKIERAKELLLYNQLSLSEISLELHYSSVAHLSAQFKKVTGFTPRLFKKMKHIRLIPLDSL